MTAYETMYILRPDLGEEQLDQTITKYQQLLKDQGIQDIDTQHRGKRRLAYEIQNFREGIYIQMNYEGQGQAIAKLEREMRISDNVIRYLTLRQENVPQTPEPSEAGDT
ncbi:MAG: 30S ribosomal protein S6 [Acaryochloris sp. CRU_2_0]|nr:30S ribosomal protein S6 [Acaryochloris sp. CRU_2_0]